MDDLVTWLRAALDEDERVAREASAYGATWRAGHPGIYPSDESRHPGAVVTGVWGDLEDEYAAHIARWDPARVLAEVDTKRRIIDMVKRWMDAGYPTMDHALFLLALPYADRSEYRPEWRP